MYISFKEEEVVALKHFLEEYVTRQVANEEIDCDGLQTIMNLRQKLLDELKNT